MNKSEEQHHRKLRQITKEYEKRGYRVAVQPEVGSLPPFLSGFQPDLVAYGPDENVIVEFKLQSELRDSPRMKALAAAIQREKGWRFELVVLNPRQSVVDKDAMPLSRANILSRVQDAKKLLAGESYEAAFLLAWTVIEAQLRLRTDESQLKVNSRSSTGQLIKQLFTLGALSREDYDALSAALDQRNTIVHGFRSGQAHEWAERTIGLAERIIKWKSLSNNEVNLTVSLATPH